MKLFIYETQSVCTDHGGVEIVMVVAEDRKAADKALLAAPDNWLHDQKHLNNVYKVEQKPILEGKVMFRADVLLRHDPHQYK